MSAVETLGKYTVRRQLGRGAMGTVYEGWDPVIERVVAIKTVRLPEVDDEDTAEEIARFRREAQAAGRLTHPNIVGVFDYGESAELAYIVMEYVDGPPLKSLLDKNERFPLPRIAQIMEDLLAGLQFSHERGVVHRDIKPANLMLTKSGQAKIADFGIARIESSSMTQAGTVLGTPAYMSPEQFMGQVVDARTDIYSSGVLLYQLLTGERPFEGSMSAIMHKALNTEAPSPSQISVTVPRPFDAVVRKAMAKRPEDRFASAADFMLAIRQAIAAPVAPAGPAADDGEATMISTPRAAAATGAAAGGTLAGRSTGAAASNGPAGPATGVAAKESNVLPIAAGVGGLAGFVLLAGLGYYFLAGDSAPSPPPPRQTATLSPPSPVPSVPVPSQPAPVRPAAPPPVVSPPVVSPPVVSPPVVMALAPPPVAIPPSPPIVQPPIVQPPIVQPPVALAPQPVTPPSVVLPPEPVTPTQPAVPQMDAHEAARAEIASFLSRLPCSMVDGGSREGAVHMAGLGGRAAIDAIRLKLGALGLAQPAPSLRITQIDPAFCQWVDLLRPVAGTFGDAGTRLSLRLADDRAWLQKDEYILPRLKMADFRSELHVDYVTQDGNVLHLYPQLADRRQRLAGDPPRVFEPGDTLNLGDPGHERPGWQVDEPYGTDLIIAIASEDALFDRPRPANAEKAAVYLRDLKKAVEAARARGARITATAMSIETRRK